MIPIRWASRIVTVFEIKTNEQQNVSTSYINYFIHLNETRIEYFIFAYSHNTSKISKKKGDIFSLYINKSRANKSS